MPELGENARVRYRRTGGFAGTTLGCELPVSELPAPLRELLGRTDLRSLNGGRPVGPDRFQHELLLENGPQSQRAVLHDGGVPDELQPLLDWLAARAHG